MPVLLRRTLLTAGAAFLVPLALSAQAPMSDADYMALGRKYFDWFLAAEADSLLAHMTPEAREGAGGVDGVTKAATDFIGRAGLESELVEERMTRRRGNPQYWREARYTTFVDEPLVFRWVLTENGEILGIGMGPKSRTPAPDSTATGS
jgi:hypothetical protein